MTDIQAIFGPPQLKESQFWVYNLSDTEADFVEFKTPLMGRTVSPLPFSLMSNVPTNTRAVITVRFNDAGVVKAFEVARYFSRPYVQHYWYMVKPETGLDKIARLAEASGFKVDAKQSDPGSLTLEDPNNKARIAAQLDGETLHITSTNPYDRLSVEYRVFVKRETAFIESLSGSDVLQ
ncbi:MAG TPA: hypothetical protein VIB79_03110 [Candidatus Binatia bacterium]